MNDPLTPGQKTYINELFRRYEDNMNKQFEDLVMPEIKMLSKYRGELARSYDGVREQRATLLDCMKELLNKQDELIGLCNQLGNMANRIEQFFLNDTPPKLTRDTEHE